MKNLWELIFNMLTFCLAYYDVIENNFNNK